MNSSSWPEVGVLFMAPSTRHTCRGSSLVSEVGRLGGDGTEFVSPAVKARMDRAFGRGHG